MIHIEKPGLLTTVQDQGRHDFLQHGVVTSGAMDHVSFRLANWLVGNHGNEAVLEITVMGPTVTFTKDALIALCGADLSPQINGKNLRNSRCVFVKKGTVLRFGKCQSGCRAYLAVAGGFDVPEIMHSKSTYLLAGIGGYHGRALQKEDQLQTGELTDASKQMMDALKRKIPQYQSYLEQAWSVDTSSLQTDNNENPLVIRVLKGQHFSWFKEKSRMDLFESTFQLTSESDRMGYRLQGEKLICSREEQILSEAVRFGTIQVPADGNPIILMADSQTTGGYPKIAETASVDLPSLALAKPGDNLQFTAISLEEAHRLIWEREKQMRIIQYQIETNAGL